MTKTITSALFVDFENFYPRLRGIDRSGAERFVTQPKDWIRRLETYADAAALTRRILIRRCYAGPDALNGHRLTLSGSFKMVDCPKLTEMKNAADIQMVMDVMDAIDHKTRVDEFIILSADADFTPLLLRLREHDRRSVVISAGPAVPAYLAAADQVIEGRDFVDMVLGTATGPPDSAAARPASIKQICRVVRELVARQDSPVPQGAAATHAAKQLGSEAVKGWGGAGKFSKAIQQSGAQDLAVSNRPPAVVYDPRRHPAP